MSLTATDLDEISTIAKNANEAIENDVKEIYRMLSKMQRGMITDESFKRLSLKDKLLTLNAELLTVAKQAKVALPRP